MSNLNDTEYVDFLTRLSARYKSMTANQPVFTTNIDTDALWEKYLGAFEQRQYHNCNACRHFLNHYAGLVVINPDGTTVSPLWRYDIDEEDDEPELVKAINRMRRMVEAAKVTGMFYSEEPMLGRDVTGTWRHFNVVNSNVFKPISRDSKGQWRTSSQEAAERQVDFTNTWRALREFSPAVVDKALELLNSGNALYRSEKVRGPAKWLRSLHEAIEPFNENQGKNIVWRAIATAPAGFARPRSSMISTLLEDIAAGMPFKDIKARFDSKMDPSNYGHSQTAPTAQQVEIAEAAVEALGIAPAFQRRYVDEFDVLVEGKVLWQPSEVTKSKPQKESGPKGGIFADLAPAKATDDADVDVPPKAVTWEKFARDVLPHAANIEYRVPIVGRFASLTTAADKNAPPILQWDNPVAWSFPNPPATAEQWNLQAGALAPVRAIATSPNLWGELPALQHGEGVFLLIEGARDTRKLPGGGLFVEHLRGDLKPYRKTIEAHINRLEVQGDGKLAFGVGLFKDHEWTEQAAPRPIKSSPALGAGYAPDNVHVLLVMDDSGSMASYIAAARTALRSLLTAVEAMPGKVDVTVIRFGSQVRVIRTKHSVESLEGIERDITGNSGSTALNDAIGRAIEIGMDMGGTDTTSYFLGIVTDGEENQSQTYTIPSLRRKIEQVLGLGNWTIAYAGAGHHPLEYANQIGIPEGNATMFEASARGFEDVGTRYAASTRSLAAAYKGGAKAVTNFFGAASGRQAIGKDLPVLVVTNKSGTKVAYKLDRWE